MRGIVEKQEKLFFKMDVEDFIPEDHPLRVMKPLVDTVLEEMSPFFDTLYSEMGAPSIPPEQLLKGTLIQLFFTIRSERQLVEHLRYNLLYKWFLDMPADGASWNASTYSKNRERLINGDVAQTFFQRVLGIAQEKDLLSSEHFSVDGTQLEAWASMKSVKPKDETKPPKTGGKGSNGFKSSNPDVDFKGEKRSNETHASTTDPEAKLYRKGPGKETKLCYLGHILMENRFGLAVSLRVTQASGTAEREAAFAMMQEIKSDGVSATLGGDKGYDVAADIEEWREMNVTPHFAQNVHSILDGRTTRHEGYHVSQKKRRRIEEIFGWLKTVAGFRKVKVIGQSLVDSLFTFGVAAFNLVRIANITRQQAT